MPGQGSAQKTHTRTHTFFSKARPGGLPKPSKEKFGGKKKVIFSISTEIPTLRLVFLFGLSVHRSRAYVIFFTFFSDLFCILVCTFAAGIFRVSYSCNTLSGIYNNYISCLTTENGITPLLSLGLSPEQRIVSYSLWPLGSVGALGSVGEGAPLLCWHNETTLLSSGKLDLSGAPVGYLHSAVSV